MPVQPLLHAGLGVRTGESREGLIIDSLSVRLTIWIMLCHGLIYAMPWAYFFLIFYIFYILYIYILYLFYIYAMPWAYF